MGMFVLNNAEIDVALTDEAIVLGLIGGGLAMIGVAQEHSRPPVKCITSECKMSWLVYGSDLNQASTSFLA